MLVLCLAIVITQQAASEPITGPAGVSTAPATVSTAPLAPQAVTIPPEMAAGEGVPAPVLNLPQNPDNVFSGGETQLFVTPTANTMAKGRTRVALAELVHFQVDHGITDYVQIGYHSVVWPNELRRRLSFVPFVNSLDAKLRFVHTDTFSAAVQAGYIVAPLMTRLQGGIVRVVGTAEMGAYALTAGLAGVRLSWDPPEPTREKPSDLDYYAGALAVRWRAGTRLSVLAEYVGVQRSIDGENDDTGIEDNLFWGLRYHWRHLEYTTGLVTPLKSKSFDKGILGYPYLEASYTF